MKFKEEFIVTNNDLEEVDLTELKREARFSTLEEYCVRILQTNGWEKVPEECDDWGDCWKKDFIDMYTTTVYMRIGYNKNHLDGTWELGVQWLDGEYEYHDRPLGYCDLKDIKSGMDIAVEHILAKGLPIHPDAQLNSDYNFTHQQQIRADKIREITNLVEVNYKMVLDEVFEGNEEKFVKEMLARDKNHREHWIVDYIRELKLNEKYMPKETKK